ncbi:hypothetical protein Hanom_Chr10g00872621 [Helianthus anomalus]
MLCSSPVSDSKTLFLRSEEHPANRALPVEFRFFFRVLFTSDLRSPVSSSTQNPPLRDCFSGRYSTFFWYNIQGVSLYLSYDISTVVSGRVDQGISGEGD